jgi:hypothetical protein
MLVLANLPSREFPDKLCLLLRELKHLGTCRSFTVINCRVQINTQSLEASCSFLLNSIHSTICIGHPWLSKNGVERSTKEKKKNSIRLFVLWALN